MAKRYKQNAKDRRNESRGMRRAFEKGVSGMTDPRRRMEYGTRMEGMINEDYSAQANLPQNAVMAYYPQTPYIGEVELVDTYRGIDYQMGKDTHNKTIKKGMLAGEKY